MIVGLTGGIGSGKSTVAKLFDMLGCPVFNSDDAAKQAYFDTDVRPQVISLLGKQAYISENQIDKHYIGSKIFSDKTLLEQLNSIIHPAVGKSFLEFKNKQPGKIMIKETALLFEAKLLHQVDQIVLVASDDELRIKRVMQRDNLSRYEVEQKINAQLPQEEKIKQAHFVIYNNEKEFLITQVIKVFDSLKGKIIV